MIRRLFKWTAIVLVTTAGIFGVLYQFFDLRVVFTGAAWPRLAFQRDEDSHAIEIARHRAAQRAEVRTDDAADSNRPVNVAVDGPVMEGASGTDTDRPEPASPPEPAAYWTSFRGPDRDGRYREQAVRTNWPAGGLTPLWKQPVGGGYASFVIAGELAFTIEQRGRQEVVAAYRLSDGLEVWTHGWDAFFVESMGGDGPRATPTWSDGLVYALGATGELRCLDAATGRLVWRKNILTDNDARNLQWGMAASPLVVDETVIVLPGGANGRSVVAYSRLTGTRVWSALSEQQAYVSPMLVSLGGQRQLLMVTASRMLGLAPEGGRTLWSYPWTTDFDINVAQPIVIGENRVFISSGYGIGAAVIELAPRGDGFDVREVWRNTRMKNKFTSSVLHEGTIYGLDESILAAVDAATGELKWKGGRYGYGQILLASGRLIVLTEDGDLVLVAASPDRHDEVGRFPAIDGKTWNHLAMANGRLLVRNLREMAAFDLRIPSSR